MRGNRASARHLRGMMTITDAGYDARSRGAERKSPYDHSKGFNVQRNKAWLEGWDCRDRELAERRSNAGT